MQRKARWCLDFIAVENSMEFDAPQEPARLLGEAIDYARQGPLVVQGAVVGAPATPPSAPAASPAPPSAAGTAP